MRNNPSEKVLNKDQIIQDYMKFSLNLNIFPRKSSDYQEALISTNTFISQQKNEDKSVNFQMNTPLDNTDTQQHTKSSSSNFMNKTSKKPIRVSKNKQNQLSHRETNLNCSPSKSSKKSLSQTPLKNNHSSLSNVEVSNDLQNKTKTLDLKLYLDTFTSKYRERMKLLEDKNTELERRLAMKENQSSRSQEETIKDLSRENERLKTNLNYYIEICTKLGEEVIHLQSILDSHVNSKPYKDA